MSKPNLLQKSCKTNWKSVYSTKHSLKDKLKFLESLFQRFLKYEEKIVNLNAVQQRDNGFELDLTPDPLAMLKDEMLEKPGKRSLRKVVMLEKNLIQKEEIFKLSGTVPGGGALLRSVRWSKGAKLSAYVVSLIYIPNACICKNYNSEVTIVLMAIKQKHKKS